MSKIVFEMDVKGKVESRDFSQPWKLSDAVLVVEDERLHVHRAVLAMASPVFEKMFTSEFQEKDSNEIPLPGKSSTEVKELLLMIYPLASEKQITEENCYFLVKLAHEYQIDAIVQKCGDFIVAKLETKPSDGILSDLVFSQTYKLEKLRQASVDQAHNVSLEELKQDRMYNQIQSENLKEIVEGIISRLQGELEECRRINEENKSKSDDVKRKIESALEDVYMLAETLCEHVVNKKRNHFQNLGYRPGTEVRIAVLRMDDDKDFDSNNRRHGQCSSLYPAANYLKSLKEKLESLKD